MRPSSQFGAISACLLWSSAFAGVKYGLGFMPVFVFAGIRFLLAGAMQLPLVGIREPARLFRDRRVWMIALFNTFFLYALFFTALSMAPGAQAAIIVGASPLVAGWMAHLLMPNDRMTLRKQAAILLGMLGITLVILNKEPWQSGVGREESIGLGLLVISCFVSSFGNILVAKTRNEISPIAMNSAQMIIGGSLLLITGLSTTGMPEFGVPLTFYVVLIYLAALSATAFAIWFFLLQREAVSDLNMWKFLVPVFGAIFSWVLLPDEKPDAVSVFAMCLVGVAVWFGTAKKSLGF